MPELKIVNDNEEKVIKVTRGEVLSKVLIDNDIPIHFPCGCKGRCAKCLVKVTSGVAPTSRTDENKLSQEAINSGLRASCRFYVEDDLTIEVVKRVFE